MRIEYYKNQKEEYLKEIEHLEETLKQLEDSKRTIPESEYITEKQNIETYIEKEQEKIERVDNIITAYNRIIENLKALERLATYKPNDRYEEQQKEEEFNRRNNEIKNDLDIISYDLLLKSEIEKFAERMNNDSTQNNEQDIPKEEQQEVSTSTGEVIEESQPQNTEGLIPLPSGKEIIDVEYTPIDTPNNTPTSLVPVEPEYPEPIEIVEKRKWKIDKKKVLIILGITSVAIATVVALQALLPAIAAASQATAISSLASGMLSNGALWKTTALATEQAALHGANTALASVIADLTGKAAIFNTTSGIWTIGGTEIGLFATQAATAAAAATAKVSALTTATQALALGGLGSIGLGTILNNKSDEYVKYNDRIKDMKTAIKLDLDVKDNAISNLIAEISQNEKLSSSEKKALLSKINKLLKIKQKYEEEEELEEEEIMNNSQERRGR